MWEKEKMYDCWLCSVPGIGDRTIEKLRAICPEPEGIYRGGERLWKRVLNTRQMDAIREFAKKTDPEEIACEMEKRNILFATIRDAVYPQRLRDIPDPPYGLFYKGRLPREDVLAVAVVGARDCSGYGEYVANGIGRALGENGVQVISGMARGIDGISQQAALDAGGSSFGVLGCGVDLCYPESNRRLYDRLCGNKARDGLGGVISTYPPGTPARPQNFPPRNRIVSGLADVLIVVEARSKSGTLITVDMALEQGKEVYVVPGRVTDRLSDGCNRLLKQGAGVFLSPEDFLLEIGAKRENRDCGSITEAPADKISERAMTLPVPGHYEKLSPALQELYGILTLEPQSIAAIGEKLKEKLKEKREEDLEIQQLSVLLMQLCMENLAVQISPGSFALGCNLAKIDYN